MQRIGIVLHVSSSGNMILKAENLPHISDKVTDENLKPIGTIFDVFGPVSSPYTAVRPSIEDPTRLIKHIVYAIPSSKPKMEKRKK